MKELSRLSIRLQKLSDDIENKVITAQKETAKAIYDDVVISAPVRSGAYSKSIKIGDTEVQDNEISTKIYTDLLIGGDDPKWRDIPLGCLLEWGTGIQGMSTNTFAHGYGYRITPWTYYDEYLHQWVTTDGMIARPHFLPALYKNKDTYKENLRKALRDE